MRDIGRLHEKRLPMNAASFGGDRNWSDLRTVDDDADAAPARTVTAWCHGATGIGLARLHSLDRLDDPALVDEVQIALDTTLREGFGHTHALCHGDMGALMCCWKRARCWATTAGVTLHTGLPERY